MISRWLGLQSYSDMEQFQKDQVSHFQNNNQVMVLGMEFHPVITMGVRANPHDDLLSTHIPVIQTDRGGQATLHSPGQLVIYPMLDLKSHNIGVKDFVQILMDMTAKTLSQIGIEAFLLSGETGVYTRQGKIAFCGLKIDSGVVRHGLSVNIKNDLGLFDNIRSCGRAQASLDLVSSHVSIESEEFFKLWVDRFREHFRLSAAPGLDMTL
jgi:lipoyl(octanoyl) transferase